MNFLAHLYLSGDDEEIIVGNFIADHVKGRAVEKYAPGIRAGIRLHREIDTFTDAHPVFLRSRSRLAPVYRKYSGVITDMFYDHFLSANWNDYSTEPIDAFTQRMYRIVMRRFMILPARTKYMLPFMARDNWLKGYGTLEGLERALRGMDRRTPFDSGMPRAVQDLRRDYELYKEEFDLFLPEIRSFSARERKSA
jgi:acyl carrier protein phosphodiesterase